MHHITAENGDFKAPSQSPSGSRENLCSICPRKRFLWRMARTYVNNLERRKFVVARGDGMAGLSGMPEQPFRRRKSGRPHDLPDFLLFIRKHSTNTG